MNSAKLRLKKGDQIRVITGKDKGKSGKILKIDREKRRVIVEGLNLVKKTQKPKREGEKGDIIEIEAYMDLSNVMVVCRKCGPTRIGYKTDAKGKPRICKKCGETL